MLNYSYRKCPRLKGYNYSRDGYYFVTICVKHMFCYFGEIQGDQMILNEYGKIVENCWRNLPKYYKNCGLDEFIIMPNHIHGIIKINNIRADLKSAYTLSDIIQGFKIFSTRQIHELFSKKENPEAISIFKWHRSFYDSIIRNKESLDRIREYIKNNPKNWPLDKFNLSK